MSILLREAVTNAIELLWTRCGPTQEPPVPWQDWAQKFQLVVIAMEEIDIDYIFAANTLPENVYPWKNLLGRKKLNCRFNLFGIKQRENEGIEQFYGALSDLSRGCDFGPKEESLVWDVFIFNMRNEEFRNNFPNRQI